MPPPQRRLCYFDPNFDPNFGQRARAAEYSAISKEKTSPLLPSPLTGTTNPPSNFTYGPPTEVGAPAGACVDNDGDSYIHSSVAPPLGGGTPAEPLIITATPSYPSTISPAPSSISCHPTKRPPSSYPHTYCKA